MFLKDFVPSKGLVLDIGNQGKTNPSGDYIIKSLDISATSRPDYIADITISNPHIDSNSFDAIMCAEVLEHVVDPFAATVELYRILRRGGCMFVSVPLNARIHGPVPDCWRFTEFGLKVMFRDWNTVYLHKLDTPDRNLFPLHYAMVVRKDSDVLKMSDPRAMVFQKVD
jgi:SAM-dependent methyltransferase